MSKNLTRKSLALGAVVALGSTLFAGTPASAADLSLAPSAGSTYSVLLGDTFTLNSAVSGNTNIANTTAWKWEIVNTSGVTVVPTATSWVTNAYVAAALTTSDTGTTKVYTPATVTSVVGKVNTLTLNPTTTSTTGTFSVTVRSFSDLDSSGSVTAGDLVSDAKTVTFVKGSEVTGTVTLDAVNAGVAPTATLTLNKDINVEQTTTPTVTFSTNGAAGVAGTVALNTAKTGFDLTAAGNASAGQNITATAKWLSYDGDTTKVSATSGGNTALAASTATTAAVTIANSADVANGVAADFPLAAAAPAAGVAGVDSAKDKIVREGTKSVSFSVAFTDANNVAVAAGQPVTVTVAETAANSLATGTVITVGGKTITASAAATLQSVTYYTTTDASGKVAVTVNSDDATAADELLVTVTANTGVAAVGLVWKTAVATALKELNEPAGYTTRVIKTGGSVALSYALLDQFGKEFTKADYNYRVALTRTAGAITITQPIVTLSNGRGTATIVENDPAEGNTFTVLGTVESQTGAGAWTPSAVTKSTVVSVASSVAVPATIALTTATLGSGAAIATTGVPLAAAEPAALDLRFNANSGTAAALTAITGAKLIGTVTQANGSIAAGIPVTISANGVAFSTESTGSTYVALNTITVYTDAAGTYTVYAFSKKSGSITITHSSGSASKTQAITWAKPAVTDGATLTVSAKATVKSGTSVPVSVKLVDKYGNGIDTVAGDGLVSVTVSGPGFTTTIADHTDANGNVNFNVILGAADAGLITVSAAYDSNGGLADVTGTTVVLAASKITLVGVSASVSAGSKKANIVVKNAEGLTVKVVSGSKSTTKVATSDSYKLSLTKLTAGKKTVKVYVNDILVSSKSVTVKR